jgi:DNA repair exonuclease SbcCD ATPase subunit
MILPSIASMMLERDVLTTTKNSLELYELVISEEQLTNKYIFINNVKYYLISNKIDKIDTKIQIEMIVGPYEHFLNSSILLQGNNKTFKLKTNSERKKTISELLNLNYDTQLIKEVSGKYTILKNYNHKPKIIFSVALPYF